MPNKNNTPIVLTLYDENDEPIAELKRLIIPWGLLKKAVRLQKDIGDRLNEPTEADIDAIANLVIEIFGAEKVTLEQLDKYADVPEMMTVLMSIVSRARGLVPNSPPQAD